MNSALPLSRHPGFIFHPTSLKLLPYQSQTRAEEELLTDGGLETWTSATDLTNWEEYTSGGSTVNREASVIHGGTYSCRIDYSTNLVFISQAPTLTAGYPHRLTFWARTANGVEGWMQLRDSRGYYLNPNGTWTATWAAAWTQDTAGAWAQHTHTFIPEASGAGNITLPGTSTSQSNYWDDVSLKILHPRTQDAIGWSFNGTSDFVSIGNPTILQIGTADFSVSCWIKMEDPGTVTRRIMSHRSGMVGWDLYTDTTYNVLTSFLGDTGTYVTVSYGTVRDQTWHHLVVTYDRDGAMAIFVDGVWQGQGSITTIPGSVTVSTNLLLGLFSTAYLNGSLSLPFIVKRVLSAGEILNIYNATKGKFHPK